MGRLVRRKSGRPRGGIVGDARVKIRTKFLLGMGVGAVSVSCCRRSDGVDGMDGMDEVDEGCGAGRAPLA